MCGTVALGGYISILFYIEGRLDRQSQTKRGLVVSCVRVNPAKGELKRETYGESEKIETRKERQFVFSICSCSSPIVFLFAVNFLRKVSKATTLILTRERRQTLQCLSLLIFCINDMTIWSENILHWETHSKSPLIGRNECSRRSSWFAFPTLMTGL